MQLLHDSGWNVVLVVDKVEVGGALLFQKEIVMQSGCQVLSHPGRDNDTHVIHVWFLERGDNVARLLQNEDYEVLNYSQLLIIN